MKKTSLYIEIPQFILKYTRQPFAHLDYNPLF